MSTFDCFHILAIVNNATLQVICLCTDFIFGGHLPETRIAGLQGNSFFNISEMSILLSIMLVPIIIPTNNVQEFLFLTALPTLTSCLFDKSHPNRCEVLTYISQMIRDIEPLYIGLLVICMSSLEKNVYSLSNLY
jgi:hypothetical protein